MKVYKNFPLKDILYYKIGGNAKYVLTVTNREDLLEALDFVQKNKVKRILPIGLGSNILVNDKFFDGVVLWFSSGNSSNIKLIDDNLIEAFASDTLEDLINFSFSNGLVGLEWAGGLPSTIGGAVRGNVGAFGGEMKDSVDTVEIVRLSREAGSGFTGLHEGYKIEKVARDQLAFDYRDSLIKRSKDILVVSATFQLQKASKEDVEKAKEVYKDHIEYRNKNHPLEFPSCGSVFKNIISKEDVEKIINRWPDIKDLVVNKWYNKVSTGYVINKLGFSGYKVGGAEVSRKHANYIVNVDGAKFTNVYSIIEKIKDKFYKIFDFYPELEVEIVD